MLEKIIEVNNLKESEMAKKGRNKEKCKRYKDRGLLEKNKANKERKRKEHLKGTRQKKNKPSKYKGLLKNSGESNEI